jgi:hypothetical protein
MTNTDARTWDEKKVRRGGDLAHVSRFSSKQQSSPDIRGLSQIPAWMTEDPIPAEHLPEIDTFYETPATPSTAWERRALRQRATSLTWADSAVTADSPDLTGCARAQHVAVYARNHFDNHMDFSWVQRNKAALVNSGAGAALASAVAGTALLNNAQMPSPATNPYGIDNPTIIVASILSGAIGFGASKVLRRQA